MPAMPANNPFLSVMIPSYNDEEYIAQAMESVLNQPCQDLELIVRDDGSKDRTVEIARRYEREDPRVIVDSHPNVGIGRNRNEGMPLVRGKALIYLDDDDVFVPGFYTDETKELVASLFDRDIEVVVPARLVSDESLSGAYLDKVPLEGVFPGNGPASLNLRYEFSTMIYSTDVIRREDLRFCTRFPEMESIFRHQAVFCAKKVLFTNDLWLLVRRDNPTQVTKTWDVSSMLEVRAEEYAKLMEWHKARGTTGEVYDEMARRTEEAQRALEDNASSPASKPGLLRRMRDAARARRDYKRWVEGMEPFRNYIYSDEEGTRRLAHALDSIRAAADIC